MRWQCTLQAYVRLLWEAMSDSARVNYASLLDDIPYAHCRLLLVRIMNLDQESVERQIREVLNKIAVHHKTREISFSAWHRVLNDLYRRSKLLGEKISVRHMRTQMLLLLEQDKRYKNHVRKVDKHPEWDLSRIISFLREKAKDMHDLEDRNTKTSASNTANTNASANAAGAREQPRASKEQAKGVCPNLSF